MLDALSVQTNCYAAVGNSGVLREATWAGYAVCVSLALEWKGSLEGRLKRKRRLEDYTILEREGKSPVTN